MKKIILAVLTIWTLLLFPVVSAWAEVDEIQSPPLALVTTKRDTGEIEITLNWENQTMAAFDYAIVYDDTKVKVKSVRFKGEFLSKYTGDTNGYGGMAVANDNGGYVVLGGIFEVREGYTAPIYNGVIATIVLVPKASDVELPASTTDTEEEEPPATPIPDFDAGTLQLIEGASNYNSSDEILNAASAAPEVSFRVNDVINSEPVRQEQSSPAESVAALPEEEPTASPEGGNTAAPVVSDMVTEVSGESAEVVSEEAAKQEPTDLASDRKTDKPKKDNQEKKEKQQFLSPIWILIFIVCALSIVIVIRAKKTQEK